MYQVKNIMFFVPCAKVVMKYSSLKSRRSFVFIYILCPLQTIRSILRIPRLSFTAQCTLCVCVWKAYVALLSHGGETIKNKNSPEELERARCNAYIRKSTDTAESSSEKRKTKRVASVFYKLHVPTETSRRS